MGIELGPVPRIPECGKYYFEDIISIFLGGVEVGGWVWMENENIKMETRVWRLEIGRRAKLGSTRGKDPEIWKFMQ